MEGYDFFTPAGEETEDILCSSEWCQDDDDDYDMHDYFVMYEQVMWQMCESTFYHATPSYYAKKIEKIGLVPKCSHLHWNYPDRISFLKTTDVNEVEDLCKMLYHVRSEHNKAKNVIIPGESIYHVYKLDLLKLPPFFPFDTDSHYPSSVCCYDNISPDSLELVKIIDVEKLENGKN